MNRPTVERCLYLAPRSQKGGGLVYARGLGKVHVGRLLATVLDGDDEVLVGFHTEQLAVEAVGLSLPPVFDVAGYLRHLGLSDAIRSLFAVAGMPSDPDERDQALVVEALRTVFAMACGDPTFPDIEFRVCAQTFRINANGVEVDPAAVRTFSVAVGRRRLDELPLFVAAYPDFDTTSLRSEQAINDYVSQAGDPSAFIESARRLQKLELAVKRADAYAKIAGVVRPLLQWNGARTGRFTSGARLGGINVHGLPKGSHDLPELALERATIVPPSGRLFCAADLSGIEARVVAWLTRDNEMLERFRKEDVYAWFGGQIIPGAIVAKTGPNAHLRALGKTSVLGLCFGMGLDTFRRKALEDVPNCTPADIDRAFDVYHQVFPRVRSTMRTYGSALRTALGGSPASVGAVQFESDRRLNSRLPAIAVKLPTGRALHYRGLVDGAGPLAPKGQWGLWYAPFDDPSIRGRNEPRDGLVRFLDGVWRAQLSGNVLLENIAQAIARDIMVHQASILDDLGLTVQFHVHDDIVASCGDCGCERHAPGCSWSNAIARVEKVMSEVPPGLLPVLADLPLAASANPRVGRSYG